MGEETTTDENEKLDAQIADEVLRHRIGRLIKEHDEGTSWWKRFSTNQLFLLILGFALSGVVGTYLAHNYNAQQAKLDSKRSFANEFNKIRLIKIAEVWEKVYVYEAAVDEVMRLVDVKRDSPLSGVIYISSIKDFEKAYALSRECNSDLTSVLNKNRLWLEDDNYNKMKAYADLYEYYFSQQNNEDLTTLKAKRAEATAILDQIRAEMRASTP